MFYRTKEIHNCPRAVFFGSRYPEFEALNMGYLRNESFKFEVQWRDMDGPGIFPPNQSGMEPTLVNVSSFLSLDKYKLVAKQAQVNIICSTLNFEMITDY